MKYNDYIEDKNILIRDFSNFLNINCGSKSFEIVDADIIQPKNSFLDCIIKRIDYEYTIIFKIKVTDSSTNKVSYTDSEIKFPKMYNGNFVIYANNNLGKWRTCINIGMLNLLIKRWDERLYCRYFNIYVVPTKELPIPYLNINNNKYPLFKLLLDAGVNKNEILNIFPDLDKYITYELDHLTDYKLNPVFDLENNQRFVHKYYQLTGEELVNFHFDIKNAWKLLKLSFEDQAEFNKLSPFDIIFRSNYTSVIHELLANRWKLIKNLENGYRNQQVLKGEYLTTAIYKIFKLGYEDFSIIQSGAESNPAALLSQHNKLYIYDFKHQKYSINYSTNFSGLICASKTPENVGGVNVRNELTKNVEIDDDNIFVNLLNKNFHKVKLDLITYYKSKILSYTNFDFDNNKVIPNKSGMIHILHKGKYIDEEYESNDQFDYIMPNAGIYAYNTALIPMVSKSDSVRMAMGTNLMDQAITTISSEPPLVATGTEYEIYEKSSWSFRSNYSGKVVNISSNLMKVQLNDGSTKIVSLPPESMGMNHTFNRFHFTVGIGDEIKKGQIIITSDSFKNDQLTIGTNVLVIFGNYNFYDEEDGFVISDELSKRLSHIQTKYKDILIPNKLDCTFDKDVFIQNEPTVPKHKLTHLNEFGLPSVGQKFHKGDIIAVYRCQVDPDKDFRTKTVFLLDGELNKFENVVVGLPYGIEEAEIIEVNVLVNNPNKDNLRHLSEYYNELNNKTNDELSKQFGEIIYKEQAITPDNSFSVQIQIKFKSANQAGMGDKLTDRHGCKGSIVKVVPKNMMPRINDKFGPPVDMIMNPRAIFNRKTISMLIEAVLGLISKNAYNVNEENIKNNNFDRVKEVLNTLYSTDKFNKYTNDELINYHHKFNGYYQLIVNAIDNKFDKDTVIKLCDYFNVDIDEGYKVYNPMDRDFIKKKLSVGILNIMRLHFFAEDKMKATGEFYSSDELVMGQGYYRYGGQKMSQMEGWALKSHGVLADVYANAGIDVNEQAQKDMMNNAAMVGLTIVPEELYN